MPKTGVIMVTTDLPAAVHHVWSREDRILVVDTNASPDHVAQAWAEISAELGTSASAA